MSRPDVSATWLWRIYDVAAVRSCIVAAERGTRRGGRGGGARSDSKSNSNGARNLAVFEGVSEEFRIARKEQLEAFRQAGFTDNGDARGKCDEIVFGKSLTNHERRYIHALAGQLGLVSKSYGKKPNRYLTIRRTKAKKNAYENKIERLPFDKDDCKAVQGFLNKFKGEKEQSKGFLKKIDSSIRRRPGGGRHTSKQGKSGQNNQKKNAAKIVHKPMNPSNTPLIEFRKSLPAWNFREQISAMIKRNPVVVLSGETGCGKSTQVPQYIMDSIAEGETCNILVSQPRRIAAMGLAERVSNERGQAVGKSVGYSVRLETKASTQTELLYCTTGVLLRKLAGNPTLDGVTHVIVDEVHERDHFSDFLLIILRELLKTKDDLRVILMSATLERGLFQKYFDDCPSIEIPGRTFPVDQYFLEDILKLTEFMGPVRDSSDVRVALPKEAPVAPSTQVIPKKPVVPRKFIDGLPGVADDVSGINLSGKKSSVEGGMPGVTEEDYHNDLEADGLAFTVAEESIQVKKDDCVDEDVLAFLDAWEDDGEEDVVSAAEKEIQVESEISAAELEIAAAKLAISTTHFNAADTKINARPMADVLNEYVTSTEENSVDITLIFHLLEYVCLGSKDLEADAMKGRMQQGGVLVFLSGWGDIAQLLELLAVHPEFGDASSYIVLPLHGSIAPQQQRQVFKRYQNKRKIVLATNIAETSITIDDIVVVIDGCKVKEKLYDPYTQMASLTCSFVSKASSRQRKGRGGRCQQGICYSLVSSARFDALKDFQDPELLRTPLEELCLQIKLLSHLPIGEFLSKAPSPPEKVAVRDAILGLQRIGALDASEQLTKLGFVLGKLPLEPRLGRMVILAISFGCLDPILNIVVSLGYRDPFLIPLDNKSRNECNAAKLKFSGNTNSDHLCNIFALKEYENVVKSRRDGGVFSFCRKHHLSSSTMRMIYGMKKQVLDNLYTLRLLPGPSVGYAWKFSNRYALRPDVIKSVVAAGLYPNILRRGAGEKNFQGRGNRKCRVQKNAVANLPGGALTVSKTPTGTFVWITFGEMLKGDRSELVRDATVLSPYSILFCTGSACSNIDADGSFQDSDEDGEDNAADQETPDSATISIDDSIQFKVPIDLRQSIEFLRTISVHGAVEATITGDIFRQNQAETEEQVTVSAVNAVVDILSRHHTGGNLQSNNGYSFNQRHQDYNRHDGRRDRARGGRGNPWERGGGRGRRGRGRGRGGRGRGRGKR